MTRTEDIEIGAGTNYHKIFKHYKGPVYNRAFYIQTPIVYLVIVRRFKKKTFLKTNQLMTLNKILCFFSYYGIDFETNDRKSLL